MARFGAAGNTNNLLHLLCGTDDRGRPRPPRCTRTINRGMTILGVAGHMHLLGRSITIETNPGTPEAKTILDIPIWDFDNQGTKPITAGPPRRRATRSRSPAQHVQWLRDVLPAFEGQPRTATSSGARAPPTRCASALLQVAFDDEA